MVAWPKLNIQPTKVSEFPGHDVIRTMYDDVMLLGCCRQIIATFLHVWCYLFGVLRIQLSLIILVCTTLL